MKQSLSGVDDVIDQPLSHFLQQLEFVNIQLILNKMDGGIILSVWVGFPGS